MKLHLRYFSNKTRLPLGNEEIEVKPYQIIVWLSLATPAFSDWAESMPRFPAILDLGNNHNLAITTQQLQSWTGIVADALPLRKRIRIEGRIARLRESVVWLHTGIDPFRLSMDKGIAVVDDSWPRLPILGLRALTASKLRLHVYGDTMQAIIRTPPPWYWPL